MSTILKSLRKLEEEKRVHEKKLNLRDLMIREDARPPVQSVLTGNRRRLGSGALFIGAGLALTFFMFVLMSPAKKKDTGVGKPGAQAEVKPAPANSGEPKLAGVPLSSIPDYVSRKAPPKEKEAPWKPIEMEQAEPAAELAPQADAQSVPVELEPQAPPAKETPAENITPAPADEEIISALEQVPPQKRTAMAPAPATTVTRPVMAEEIIPGLKLKGIVFFGEDSKENYLFFTLPGMSIHRLKVGETVEDAKLIAIHPGVAVFEYQGRDVELRVGS